MIDRIIISVDTNVLGSNYIDDHAKFEQQLLDVYINDFKTNQLSFLNNHNLDNVNSLVLRYENCHPFKDVYFVKDIHEPNKRVNVTAIVGIKGKLYNVTERLVRRAHNLEKMFMAGEFDGIIE